jgi:signal transduction histidine kinase
MADDGVAIDPVVADRGKEGRFELQGIRKRATRIGGKLSVVSSSTSGAEIRLVAPGGIIFQKTRPLGEPLLA